MAERRAGTPAPLAGTLKLAPVSGQAEGIEIKPRRAFVKVEFRVPAGMVDEAAGILAARGALGCAARWPHRARQSSVAPVTLQAFFNRLTAAQVKAHHAALDSAGMLDPSGPAPIAQALIDPGWAVMWKKRFKPLAIGKTLAIVPPWNPNPPRGRIPVIIDPGLGFGTGHHPTTRCALIALETECARRHFETALDVGTGSGVLALAMARLGVKRIVALDNDPQALDNARHDAQLNGCAGAIRFSAAPLRTLRRTFALITANILSSVLIAMAPELTRLQAPGGRLILSGILAREAEDVMRHYRPAMRRMWSRTERGWTTLILGSRQQA
ncbi:MAG: 50S ribosomal protein L11 methyltransferase [Candidatus Binataceae bacterium]